MPSVRSAALAGLFVLVCAGPQSTPTRPEASGASCNTIPAQAVGTQPGAFSVNANGGATYAMDLEVPQGTNGAEPTLSIWYGSQNANGLLGNGFTLQGLSAITRCEASVQLDRYNGGIGFDSNDRFCLDGQRLINISGDYGAPGSVYRTEIESWTEVTAIGACGSGPCSFVAHNKDGWTLEFGAEDSATPLPNQREIASWQIKSSTDLNGNRVYVSYQLDSAALQNLPKEILYTENTAAGIAATRKVTLEYEPRTQRMRSYAGGYAFLLEDRLKSIRTWLDGQAVLVYSFFYRTSAGTGRDLLCSIQKCTATGQCYPATTFTYQEETNDVVPPNRDPDGALYQTPWCTEPSALIGWADFNGDGAPDLHCDTKTGTHRVLLSTGTALVSPNEAPDGQVRAGWCAGSGFTPSWNDFNGDGRADLACDGTDGSHRVLVSNGRELDTPNDNADGLILRQWCAGSRSVAHWGNFNGDGRADLLCNSGDGLHKALLSTGTGVKSPNRQPDGRIVQTPWCQAGDAVLFWADFNGDSMADAHCSSPSSGTQQVLLSNGTDLVTPNADPSGTLRTGWCKGSGNRIGVVDFNGDGLLDTTCDSDTGRHWVLLSTGRDLASPNEAADGALQSSSPWCTGKTAVSAWSDFNGDGFGDLQCRNGDGSIMALLSTGTNLIAPGSSPTGVLHTDWCTAPNDVPGWVDMNADSLGDVTCYASGQPQALVHVAGVPDLVTRITDGVGQTIDVTYASLTDANVYTAGGSAKWPSLDVRSPMYVVSRYVIGDGRGAQYAFRYAYRGARTDVEAQRWLGFEEVAFTEEAIGRRTVTTYRQEYPLISFVLASSILDANGRTLARTAYTPLVRSRHTNVWETFVASESTSTYTAGTVDYTEVRTYAYDDYGNQQYIADVSAPYFEVYTCAKYDNSTNPWRLGFPTEQKTTRTSQACLDFLSGAATGWNAATDLRWSRTRYDSRMNPTAVDVWDDRNNAFLTTSRTFNGAGGALSETDPGGNVTSYTWDDTLTYPATQTSPPLSDGRHLTASFTFHRAFGVRATTTDANGNEQATRIDGFGRPIEFLGPDPSASSGAATVSLETYTYSRDTTGRYVELRRRQTWADANIANWFYSRRYEDGLGRVFLERNRSARTGVDVLEEVLFDNAGREWKRAIPHYSNETPNYTLTLYDLLDRPTSIIQPDRTTRTIQYLKGALQMRITEASRTTVDTYDPRGLNLTSTAPNGGVTTTTYDPVGLYLKAIGPTGRTTVMARDSLGRPVTSTDGDTGTTTWSYGTDALLHATSDGAGNTITFEYDSLNRPTRRTLQSASGTSDVYAFQYDNTAYANGQGSLTTVTGPGYTEDYSYSRYSLVAVEQLTLDGNVYSDKSDYDPARRTILRTFADGAQLRTTYFVDGTLNRQEFRSGASSNFADYATYTSYDALRQPVTLLYGNGLRTDKTYYSLSTGMARLKTTAISRQTDPASAILTRTYAWDNLSELTSLQHQRAGEPPQTESYTYDDMGFLTNASGAYGNLEYTYDLAGNLTKKDGVTYQYTPSSDRLQSANNGVTFTHDGAGNLNRMQSAGTDWQYQHDAASRLTSVLLNDASVARHLYDSDDQRIRRIDRDGNVSIYLTGDSDIRQTGEAFLVTKYILGVDGPIAAVTAPYTPQAFGDVLRNRKAALDPERFNKRSFRGLTSWSGAMMRLALARISPYTIPLAAVLLWVGSAVLLLGRTRYRRRHPLFTSFVPFVVCGLVLLGTHELHADLDGGAGYPVAGTLYFHGDQVDSTILVTSSDGNETTRVAYRPYGSIDQPRSAGANDFRPKFTTKERDEEAGLDYFGARYYASSLGRFLEPDPRSQFASAYVYAGNNPSSMVDPDGRWAIVVAILAGAIIGAYFGGVAVNHNNYNPLQWDWDSSRTYAGMFAGAAIGAATGGIGAAIAEASTAAGIAAEIFLNAGDNAAFTALGGGSKKEILESAMMGAAIGAVTGGAAPGIAAVLGRDARTGSRMARRADREMLDDAGDGASVCASFPAGTLVATADGLTPIESIPVGTPVLALETEDAKATPFPVIATHSRSAAKLVEITAGGVTIRASEDHPFWVESKGWTPARTLQPGDRLVTAQGTRVAVERASVTDGVAPVFNFEVARAQTYFVSPLRVLVHNVRGGCRAGERTQRVRHLRSTERQVRRLGMTLFGTADTARITRQPLRYGWPIRRFGPGRRLVNFGGAAVRQTEITLTGVNRWDFEGADRRVGITEEYRRRYRLTWHHMDYDPQTGLGTMQLVPTALHQATPHWGGEWLFRRAWGWGYGP